MRGATLAREMPHAALTARASLSRAHRTVQFALVMCLMRPRNALLPTRALGHRGVPTNQGRGGLLQIPEQDRSRHGSRRYADGRENARSNEWPFAPPHTTKRGQCDAALHRGDHGMTADRGMSDPLVDHIEQGALTSMAWLRRVRHVEGLRCGQNRAVASRVRVPAHDPYA